VNRRQTERDTERGRLLFISFLAVSNGNPFVIQEGKSIFLFCDFFITLLLYHKTACFMLLQHKTLVRTGIPSSYLHRLIIPDDVLIKFDLLMIDTLYSKSVGR